MTRDAALAAFLARTDWAGLHPAPLAGDASNRRYLRIAPAGGKPVVAMDAPPEKGEDTRPFIAVTRTLRALCLSAPAILAADPAQGFVVLEDLGDALYARLLEREPALEQTIYAAAVDLLLMLHTRREAARDLPPYDTPTYTREAALVTDWYLPAAAGTAPDPATTATFQNLIAAHCAPLAAAPAVCVLRDYHAENLIWLPERAGVARVGLLDYQDALAGHPAYDLVSLLEDARRDTGADLRDAMIARYLAGSGADPTAFRRAYCTLGAQRNLKILGIFARLCRRDGKPAYLGLLPRVWDHLMRDLAHPDLADLRAWVAANLPAPDADVRARLARA